MNDETSPRAEATESRTPLERFGAHHMDCRKRGGADRYYGQHPCSCGLDLAIEAEAAQGTETRAAQPLEAIPGWMAEEEGGTYYRQEQVDALLVSQGIWIAEGTGPIEALPGGAQGAAPRGNAERHEGLDVERLTEALGIVFPDIGAVPFYGEQIAAEYDRLSGAAPRAKGLTAGKIASALADCPDLIGWTLHERDRLAADLHVALARLSRPSDEEEGSARAVCKRFRHDEHCIDEPHA